MAGTEGKLRRNQRASLIAACGAVVASVGYTAVGFADSPQASAAEAAGAQVRALISRAQTPTVGELERAFLLADEVRKNFPGQPWGYAAMCDIAERLGDDAMLQKCVSELERVAPKHPETARHAALLRRRSSWRPYLGWLLVAGPWLATLVHALRSIRRRLVPRGRVAVAVALVCLGALLASRRAHAEPSPDHPGRTSNWPIDDQNPEGSIPTPEQRNRNPVEFGYWLQDLAYKASWAAKRGDHIAAIRYFRAMATAVPDRAVSVSRLCEEYEAVGQTSNAIAACGAALQMQGVKLKDYTRYVGLVLNKPGTLSTQEVTSLWAILDHLRQDPAGSPVYDELKCEVAVRIDDFDKLKECVTAMAATAPGSPTTILYEWTLAMKQKDYDGARSIIKHGRRAGVKPEAIARMEKGTDDVVAELRKKTLLTIFGIFLSLAAAAAGVVLLLRRPRRPAPPPPHVEAGIAPAAESHS
jgi:hypothetical protein